MILCQYPRAIFPQSYQELGGIVNQTYSSFTEFELALSHLATPLDDEVTHIICEAANLGQKSFQQQLGWIEEFRF